MVLKHISDIKIFKYDYPNSTTLMAFFRSSVPFGALDSFLWTLANSFSSSLKNRGLAIFSPLEKVAKLSRIQTETRLRIRYAIVATSAFESWISWILVWFDPAEERLECQFHSQYNVLECQRMDFFVLRMIHFELWQSILSLKAVDMSLLFLPSVLSIC